MSSEEPQILYQKKLNKTKLYKGKVLFTYDDENEENKNGNYIIKYLPFLDKSSSMIRIDPVLCEAFINQIFKNKYLNTAEYVSIQSGIIVLFFKEALGDFHTVKRKNDNLTRKWIISIMKGLSHLHIHRILHGDIKASNIIIYDDEAKLSDFGMSSLILGNGKQKYSSPLYTPSHRPPEVWNEHEWGLSADIWALGCTIYEMIYGFPLFEIKNTKQEYLIQMDSWLNGNKNSSIKFSKSWNKPENKEINSLILKMLNGDSKMRPTIFELLSTFENIENNLNICTYDSLDTCSIVSHRIYRSINFRNKNLFNKITNTLNILESDKEIKMLAYSMYESYIDDDTFNIEILKTILIVIHLLTHRVQPNIFNLTINDKNSIIKYSNDIKFNYINWKRFYAVRDKFK